MTVVIETAGEPDSGGDASFQAGVAAATATQAAEEAAEAEATAEQAEEIAEGAQRTATQASMDAWDAKSAVAGLEAKVDAGFAELRDLLAGQAADDGDSAGKDDGTPPAPERIADPAPAVEPDKPAEESKPDSSYGSKSWFGRR